MPHTTTYIRGRCVNQAICFIIHPHHDLAITCALCRASSSFHHGLLLPSLSSAFRRALGLVCRTSTGSQSVDSSRQIFLVKLHLWKKAFSFFKILGMSRKSRSIVQHITRKISKVSLSGADVPASSTHRVIAFE